MKKCLNNLFRLTRVWVETSHWIIEKEFYDYINAPNIGNLMKKFRAYQWGFNTLRKNGYRANITPLESLRNEHNKNYATLSKEIIDFSPAFLIKSSISLSRVDTMLV